MRGVILGLLCAALLPVAVMADPVVDTTAAVDPSMLSADILMEIGDLANALIEDDDASINAALLPLIRRGSGLQFLRDIRFEPKVFDTTDGGTGLGFGYDYYQEIAPRYVTTPTRTRGIQGELRFRGNVAVEKALNPEDFLDSRFAFKLFQNSGGVAVRTSEEYQDRLNELEDILVEIEDPDELANHPATIEMFKLQNALSSQFYLSLALHGGLEADQEFKHKNYTYGAELGFVYRSYDPDALTSMLNVFDWPTALVRALTGYEETTGFTPYGSTWPSLLLAIDQVEPSGDSLRTPLGEDDGYARFRGEVAFRSPIAELAGSRVYFDVNYRVFAEIDPSEAVQAANLDLHQFLILTLSSTKGLFASYTDGRLPFDVKDRQSSQLGFRFNLQ